MARFRISDGVYARCAQQVIAVRDDFAFAGKAYDHVCFDEFGFQFFLVSLGQAARDNDAATASVFFVFCGVHYCCD